MIKNQNWQQIEIIFLFITTLITTLFPVGPIMSEEQSEQYSSFMSNRPTKRKLSSVFEYKTLGTDKYGKCLLCHAQQIEKMVKMKNSNTTGLKRHLQNHHKYKFLELYGSETSDSRRVDIEVEETSKNEKTEDLLKKMLPSSTIRCRKFMWSAFKKFCHQRNYFLNESTTSEQLSEILADWGFNMKKSDGTDYKEGVVKTIWNTTAKMLQEMFYDKYSIKFDPFRDVEFKKARDSRDIKRNELKFRPEKRKASSTVLNEAERMRIFSIWDENTPIGLQRKFYHVAAFELSWKGRAASNCLVTHFRKEFDQSGNFTGRIEYNTSFDGGAEEGTARSKWLIANPVNPANCPVRLLFKLLEKRKTNDKLSTNRLFLAPNTAWHKYGNSPWYRDFPIGANQIATWVKEAAEKIGIDTQKVKITNSSNCPSTSKIFKN